MDSDSEASGVVELEDKEMLQFIESEAANHRGEDKELVQNLQ
jgi:hypothetical protein